MRESLLSYDGTTHGLSADVAKDLLERGIIVVDPSSDIYALSPEHEIEEVEPFATVLERSDALRLPRLGRLRVRGFSLLGGVGTGFATDIHSDVGPPRGNDGHCRGVHPQDRRTRRTRWSCRRSGRDWRRSCRRSQRRGRGGRHSKSDGGGRRRSVGATGRGEEQRAHDDDRDEADEAQSHEDGRRVSTRRGRRRRFRSWRGRRSPGGGLCRAHGPATS